MIDEVDLVSPAALGERLLNVVRRLKEMDSLTPGATADWGLLIDGTVFQLSVRVVRDGCAPEGSMVQ